MPVHSAMVHAEVHEPKHITNATTADAGKVITPSSGSNGVSVLRSLAVADLSDGATVATQTYANTAVTNERTAVATLTNKRITPRISAVTYAANIGVDSDSFDILACASLTGNVIVDAPTGTPTDGQRLVVRLTQDATGGRTITYNAAFVTTGATVTTLSTTETREFMWHAGRAKWIQLAFTSGI